MYKTQQSMNILMETCCFVLCPVQILWNRISWNQRVGFAVRDSRLNRGICPPSAVTQSPHDEGKIRFYRWGIFAGNNFRSTFPITIGWCSPALPANVYDRSNPFGPSTFISQLSFAREPTIDTRQSPALSLRACSTSASTSRPTAGSPVLCSSIETAISVYSTVGEPSGSHSRGWLRHDSRGLPAHRSCASRKIATANLVRLPSEDQKIIHAVGFHEIL